jgi:hypothetical protein
MRPAKNMSIGWLDLNEDDQRRAQEYLRQYNGDNTLDELGFGILRDAFADVFFPGTSTIMTRARYLIFLPAMCLAVESEKLSGKRAEERLKELEDTVRESLQEEESRDVIGEVAGEKLKRYPSSIYWNSLRRLGIFLHPWGLSYYLSHLAAIYAAMTPEKDDDGLSHLNNSEVRNWDRELCQIISDGHPPIIHKGQIPPSIKFLLTPHEARFLRDKYQRLALTDGRPSIISHLVERLYPDFFTYPWQVPQPHVLEPYIAHARCFSEFTRGATLQYFYLLHREREARSIDKPSYDLPDVFKRWWEATRHELANWSVDDFLAMAVTLKAIRRPNDIAFIKSWLQLNVKAPGPRGMLKNAAAHELIRNRERITRPTKSRLYHTDYLERWTPPKPAQMKSMTDDPDRLRFGLDYRGWIGSNFVRDIVNGLSKVA